MTRVNVVDVKELTDQHLLAEYREILMVGSSLQRSLRSPKWDPKRIPKEYTLNKGHVTFFYDKGLYLLKRYSRLRREMKRRGMRPDKDRHFNLEKFPDDMIKDWVPTERDREINRERIANRISEKPDWYRHTWC